MNKAAPHLQGVDSFVNNGSDVIYRTYRHVDTFVDISVEFMHIF